MAVDTPGAMPLIGHLTEFRIRLFRAALALLAGSAVGYLLFPMVLDVIIAPYCAFPQALRTSGSDCALLALRPLDPFSVRMKTAAVMGLFLAGPVIFYQVWRFTAPGLQRRERRYAAPFVVGSQIMFALGMAFAAWVLPKGLQVLLSMGGPGIVPALTAAEYVSFYLTTSVAFGIVFELPLILIFLSLLGVVTAAGLRRFRPIAVVANLVVAAVVTPTTDAVTLLFMAGPMIMFYEAAIVASWLIERSRRRTQRASFGREA